MKTNKQSGLVLNRVEGFTLIEMLVVVAIIGLLSSVVVVGVGGARQKARDTKRIADMVSIQTWAETNYASGAYPTAANFNAWTSQPKDPINTGTSIYSYTQCSSQLYVAHAVLEAAGNRPPGGLTALPTGCTGVTCNATTEYCVAPS